MFVKTMALKGRFRGFKHDFQAKTICRGVFVMESGIKLFLEKMIFYLRIEEKVWKQRAMDWYGKDDKNTAACKAAMETIQFCHHDLSIILKKHKEAEGLPLKVDV